MSTQDKYDDISEEFNNFMYRVNEVSSIVNKLASDDENIQKIGDIEARRYLGEEQEGKIKQLEQIGEDEIVLTVKSNRTILNKEALHKDENPEEKSQEAFMAEVEKDANQRHKDRLRRTERMETLKKQANLAFKRKEYEKALTLYGKGLEQIKDSITLYLNKALTLIKLKMYKRALDDLHWALRLNEDSLKGWLLQAKCHYLLGEQEEYEKDIEEAKERNPNNIDFITEFISQLDEETEDED